MERGSPDPGFGPSTQPRLLRNAGAVPLRVAVRGRAASGAPQPRRAGALGAAPWAPARAALGLRQRPRYRGLVLLPRSPRAGRPQGFYERGPAPTHDRFDRELPGGRASGHGTQARQGQAPAAAGLGAGRWDGARRREGAQGYAVMGDGAEP